MLCFLRWRMRAIKPTSTTSVSTITARSRISIGWICEAVGASPSIVYSGGDRGWIGDNPFIFLDNTKIWASGWSPKLTIKQGVLKTVEFLRANEWVYEARQ